jgi:hypothetical protein
VPEWWNGRRAGLKIILEPVHHKELSALGARTTKSRSYYSDEKHCSPAVRQQFTYRLNKQRSPREASAAKISYRQYYFKIGTQRAIIGMIGTLSVHVRLTCATLRACVLGIMPGSGIATPVFSYRNWA